MTFPMIRLKRVCRLQGGLTVDASRDVTGDVATRPYLRVANVQAGRLELDSVTEISVPRRMAEASALQFGDVLMTEGGDLDKLGRGTMWREEISDCLHQNHVFALRPHRNALDPRFLAYVTQASPSRHYFESTGTRTTNLASTSSSKILDLPIPYPPLHEQRRIADFLDAETLHIDKLVATKRRASLLIDERRNSLASHLCLRGLNPCEKMRDSDIGPLGQIPSSWRVARNKSFLAEVADLSENGKEELLSVSHLTGVTPRSEKTVYMFMADSLTGYKICRKGDLVINTLWAWMGALGVSKYSGIVSPAYGVYRFTSDETVPGYFDHLYRTPEYVCEMTRHSKGVWTSRLRLYPESFLALKAPIPSRQEQERIVKAIAKETEPAVRLQGAIQQSIALIADRRQALITAAVTGQIDVSTASGRGVTEGTSS
ncbi:restriction endonuclease subunit S [Plantactinospora sp. KLBMP9567]|uniref:restriction endonuclease subunit S n=1 Tax=Plantactinospora sp. KLBMP9567 TaxID=3085900 RepID=UPI0029818FFE|nr:restriction endonuclease subunit S [Plantactinospora sp. KLBMP9567]MDW5330553.1 restriction endonuclease subunit S [Plantactinospora sp. KLBMP9567]